MSQNDSESEKEIVVIIIIIIIILLSRRMRPSSGPEWGNFMPNISHLYVDFGQMFSY